MLFDATVLAKILKANNSIIRLEYLNWAVIQ